MGTLTRTYSFVLIFNLILNTDIERQRSDVYQFDSTKISH